MPNVLNQGSLRVGWLADGNPTTPHLAVTLEDTVSRGIELTVPFRIEPDDPYHRWFMGATGFAFPSGQQVASAKLPRTLLFQDSYGTVLLRDCRPNGFHFTNTIGQGKVLCGMAILGARHMAYEKVNVVRSELPGLSTWMGVRGSESTVDHDEAGLAQRVVVTVDPDPDLRVLRRGNLKLKPSFRVSHEAVADTTTIHTPLLVETSWVNARDWWEHLELHLAIRDLLVVSAWFEFGFGPIQASLAVDSQVLPSGGSASHWCTAVSHDLPEPSNSSQSPRFLFEFRDIGLSGLRRWLRIRRKHARALMPLIAIPGDSQSALDTHFVRSCMALEALGFDLAVEQGWNPKKSLPFSEALRRVYGALASDPLSSVEQWVSRSNTCYRGVKHPDNPVPSALDMAEALRDNVTVARAWIAEKVGMKRDRLTRNLAIDPQATARYEVF